MFAQPEEIVGYSGAPSEETEADDEFSQKVKKIVGDDFSYRGKTAGDDSVMYVFCINNKSSESIEKISKAINELLIYTDGRTIISICEEIDGFGKTVIRLKNYSDLHTDIYAPDSFYSLSIEWWEFDEFWTDIETYTCIEGIEELRMPDILNESAKEKGIDLYDVWPELKEVEVFKTDRS